MRLIKPSYEILTTIDGEEILKQIERAARTCYKSEDRIGSYQKCEKCNSIRCLEDCGPIYKFCETNLMNLIEGVPSHYQLVNKLLKRGHEAMLEFAPDITVKFVCDRGVSHEFVRHRLASFAQESTRYVGYSNKTSFENLTEEDIISLYKEGHSTKKISTESKKHSEWEIYKILNKNNIKRRNLGNTGNINTNYFKDINTPEKAYLLGFILADGNIRAGEKHQITITQKNGWFIERLIKDFIKPNIKPSKDRNCNQYSFCNKDIWDDLYNKGIIPNKSNDMTFDNAEALWDSIHSDYRWNFLRGFLDGDGSIRFFKQENKLNTDSCNITWNGNYYILEHISKFLFETLKYKTNISKVSGTNKLFRVSVTKPSIGELLIKKMYKNFKFPYGHPVKTSRAYERVKFEYKLANWGSEQFQIIIPSFFSITPESWIWAESMDTSEENYSKLINFGWSPQQARAVLPNSLKTEINIKTNLRHWREIFKQRVSKAAHPQMRELMVPLLKEFQSKIPLIFDDIQL